MELTIWEVVDVGYTTPSTPPTDAMGKKLYESDSKKKNTFIYGLVDSDLVKIMGCKTKKEIWDKLTIIHEGDDKIKETKLHTFTAQLKG